MSEIISGMNATNKQMEKEKFLPYKTLPRRIFAGMLDLAIYTTISIFILILSIPFNSKYIFVILWSIMIPLNVVYVIVTTKIWGGTLGKLYFNIAVLDSNNDSLISWKQSFLRELINTVVNAEYLIAPFLFIGINNYFNYSDYLKFSTSNLVFNIIDFLFIFVFFIEVFTAASNSKRRSVHDYIGGTIVKITGKYRKFSNYIAILSLVIIYIIYFRLYDYVVING